jgi:acyl-CoA reductase-like NAD-dependent aldehyde dehydrogenase
MTSPFAAEAAACRAAQADWSTRSIRDRFKPIRELRHRLVEQTDAICAVVSEEIGRPAAEVVGTELLPTAAAFQFLEQSASRILKPRKVGSRPLWLMGSRDAVHRRPWGTVGIIGTWNYPVYLNAVQIAIALVAGNAVLWKPSELAPRTALLTHQLFLESGIPPALFARLPATREGGSQLAEADVDHVVFTGSDRVGRILAARLGERLIPSTLELSGIDAMFVLEDADVKLAARAAWFGLTLNRGQTCIAVRRIFVHRSRVAEFSEALKPFLKDASPVALLTAGQAAHAKRLLGLPSDSTSLPPTVLFDAAPDAALCREAAFAPIAAVIPFDAIDTAMSLAAESPFGLSASIFSQDTSRAAALAARIRSGSVVINDVLAPTAHPATPFGGRGDSGWGVTQGEEGLLAMTVPQVVTVRKGSFRPHFDEAAKPDPSTLPILRGLLQATHGRGFLARLAGLRELIRGIRRKR